MNMSDRNEMAKWFAAALGVILVAVGLLGFVDNPIASGPQNDPIFVTGFMHNIVHIATGLLALVIAFGMSGAARANALIGFGALYGLVLVGTLVSPDLFGILEHPVNAADHVLHVLLTAAPILVGWLARSELTEHDVSPV